MLLFISSQLSLRHIEVQEALISEHYAILEHGFINLVVNNFSDFFKDFGKQLEPFAFADFPDINDHVVKSREFMSSSDIEEFMGSMDLTYESPNSYGNDKLDVSPANDNHSSFRTGLPASSQSWKK